MAGVVLERAVSADLGPSTQKVVVVAPEDRPCVQARGLGKCWPGRDQGEPNGKARWLLRGVDLSVRVGQTLAIIGPSGSGKSSFLRCLNGLASFEEGEVVVGAHRLLAQPLRLPERRRAALALEAAAVVRQEVGFVFQDFQLFPHLTALENVVEAPIHAFGRPRREAVRRAEALLVEVGLKEHVGSFPHQLSGGQKQRVALARALALEPKVLLCDEITSALDPEMKHEVLGIIEQQKRVGMTLVMVTHELGFARRAADHVALLAAGSIVEYGSAEQVLERPTQEVTRRFLSAFY